MEIDTNTIWKGGYFPSKFREKVDSVLRENFNFQLKRVNSNLERVITMLQQDPVIDLVAEWSDLQSHENLMKNATISDKLRNEANVYYKERNFIKAIKGFTLALCFAPEGSREKALAFSNRSACFMEIEHFERCLKDCDASLQLLNIVSDSNVKFKVLQRKERCAGKVEELEKEMAQPRCKMFTLKNPSSRIKSAEEFIEIKESPGKGRHVVVNRDVPIGTTIILEAPFTKVLVHQYEWETDFCHQCFKDIRSEASLPCSGCVFALYCSETCLKEDAIHISYECKASPFLHLLRLKRIVLLSFRTILKLTPEYLMSYKNRVSSNNELLGFESGSFNSTSYHPIHSLIYHEESLSEDELRQYTIEAILLTKLLCTRTNYFHHLQEKSFVNYVSSLILLHQLNYPCNAHSLQSLQLPECPTSNELVSAIPTDFGAGAFALLSMINHSCDPNVTRITLNNGVVAVVTMQSLKQGDEVLDNYGIHFALQKYEERQKHLKDFYCFQCECAACRGRWGTLDELERKQVAYVCGDCYGKGKQLKDVRLDGGGRLGCRGCGRKYQINSLRSELEINLGKFDKGYDLLLKGDVQESVALVLECLQYFGESLELPNLHACFSQETLKRGWALL